MAETKIADVIVPEVFNPYVMEKTVEYANFYMGGIVSNDAQLNVLAQQGGSTINMPFWQDLTGDAEILSDGKSLSVDKITAGQDKAALHVMGKAWGVNDLAKALSGDRDVMGKIGDKVAEYWARQMQKVLVASLVGVMADNKANDGGDMQVDVSKTLKTDVTADTKMSGDVFIDGQATFGDALGMISGIAMHSHVYNNLKKIDNISFEKESLGNLEITTYRGIRVIVDDKLPYTPATATDAPVYTSYLFGDGAFGYGQGNAPVPSETDRDSLASIDVLVTRTHFVMHPRGVKFTNASVAGVSPTEAELKNASNWDRVYDRKNVRIAAIVTNG